MIEREIINGCLKGDRRCQRMLVDEYAPSLMATCMRYAIDRATAQDNLQESWILIFKNLHTYKPTGSFAAWMQRIAITTSLKHFRKKEIIKKAEQRAVPNGYYKQPDVYSKMTADDITNLIEELPYRKKVIFNLAIIEGYAHEEISELLNITTSTSRAMLTRARKQVKELLLKNNIANNYESGKSRKIL